MASVEIDMSQMQELQKNLGRIAEQIGSKVKGMMAHIGAYQVQEIETRYKNSGPNSEGAPFYPILLSSYLARTRQRTDKGYLTANRKRGDKYAAMSGMTTGQAADKRVRIPNSQGHPLVTTNQEHSKFELTNNGYTLVVTPTRKVQKGKHSGEYVVKFFTGEHPTMFNRFAHYLSAQDKAMIEKIAEKDVAEFIKNEIKK